MRSYEKSTCDSDGLGAAEVASIPVPTDWVYCGHTHATPRRVRLCGFRRALMGVVWGGYGMHVQACAKNDGSGG